MKLANIALALVSSSIRRSLDYLEIRSLSNSKFNQTSTNQDKPKESLFIEDGNDKKPFIKSLGGKGILGGVKTKTREFPWIVSIGTKKVNHTCGGTLIHQQVVLSAAHCVLDDRKADEYFVKYGTDNLSDRKGEKVEIKQTIKHENYKEEGDDMYNDIALFVLKNPIKNTAQLANFDLTKEIDENKKLVVAGWGHTSFNGKPSNQLLKVNLTGLSSSDCKKKWPLLNGTETLCAWFKEGGKDSCQGDSGGPISIEDPVIKGGYKVIGIVSNGKGCGQPNTPGTYTRISTYLPWIRMKIEGLGFKLPTTFTQTK